MRLTFLGTRGNTEAVSRRHRRHSALMVETPSGRTMFDCGADWARRLFGLAPDAIFVTHAHPDHADGLAHGAPCPVYASAETRAALAAFPIEELRTIARGMSVRLNGLTIRAFPLAHSLLAPAVGYRVTAERASFFYAPDVVAISDPKTALSGARLYIGDGASITRPLVRRRGAALFGHTTVRAQIGWCGKWGVPEAIFTHCGSELVSADARDAAARVRTLGEQNAVRARIAFDGLSLTFPAPRPEKQRVGRLT